MKRQLATIATLAQQNDEIIALLSTLVKLQGGEVPDLGNKHADKILNPVEKPGPSEAQLAINAGADPTTARQFVYQGFHYVDGQWVR